jgi:DNA processing protein
MLVKEEANGLSEKTAFLALSSIRGIGYWTLYNMARAQLRFSEFLDNEDGTNATALLKKFGARLENTADWKKVRSLALDRAEKIATQLDYSDTTFLRAGTKEFPTALYDLKDPPEWLFVQGDFRVLQRRSITAVGTREPTQDGLWLANFVGANLGIWNSPTVSGLAAGIDQMIHTWSLRNNVPTIAVLGNGIFSDFPKGSGVLRERILDAGGAVVSEYLPNDSYSAENFVRRNRIQAALGSVLIPVEWAVKSGTAHTVRYSSTLNRPIAGLRLHDWSAGRVVLPISSEAETALFTIPGHENEFRQFVASALSDSKNPVDPIQRDLFR